MPRPGNRAPSRAARVAPGWAGEGRTGQGGSEASRPAQLGLYAPRVLTLWQAEWCPYSARVRETLTEYGVDFVAKQVAAERANREAMREATGTDAIPLLVREDGMQIDDWQEMLEWIRATYERPADADRHREKWFEDAPLRDPKHVLT